MGGIGVRGHLGGFTGITKRRKEGSSQPMRVRIESEGPGRGRLYLLSLAGPGCCYGLGGACLFETRQIPIRTYSIKCMEWNELKEACTMPDRCLEQGGPLFSGIQPRLILWEGRSPELFP